MKKRRSFGKVLSDTGRYFRLGLKQPLTMASAKINVGVWGVILASTVWAIGSGVLNENWLAAWINLGFGLFQGTALRWSIHGLMYRKEIRAKEAEEMRFIEVIKSGYEINDEPPKKKRRT